MKSPAQHGTRPQYIVMATARAKPGREADLEGALRAVVEPTRRQPGCLSFHLYRPVEAPGTIMAFECWATEADHDRHLQGDHVKRLMAVFGDVIAGPPTFLRVDVLTD